MSRLLVALTLLVPAFATADEIVNTTPSPAELGRYAVIRTADTTARVDTATGASWFLCNRKGKQAWCRSKDIPGLPGGPVGRYKVVDSVPLLMIDTVTGRSWLRCELPTPEKGLAWCALEE
ncbi:MAG: hypothetical protein ACOZQL_14620 [Myxococcota bacterium]